MKFTIPHGIAAVFCGLATLLPVLQTVLPAAVPGPTGIAIAGGIGLAVTLGHSVWDGIKANVTVKCLPFALALVACGGAASHLTGCTSAPTAAQVAQAQPYITVAVDIAVATAEQKGVSAAQINAIAHQALVADQSGTATLAAVAALVNGQLTKLKLPPADLAAANVLEVALSAAIQAKIGGNPNVATTQAALADVLNSVIAATGG